MDLDGARSALTGSRFATLDRVAETGSTNSDLLVAARDGGPERVLVADHQTAGRGRLDRAWEAPPGASLLMSVLVRPPFPDGDVHLLPTALGVAAVDAVRELAAVPVGLKWPNDIVDPQSDRKLGGLLGEFHPAVGTQAPAVILGIGLNVSWPDGFPDELAPTATALDLLGADVDRWALVVVLLTRLERLLATLTGPEGASRLRDRHRDDCVTIGRTVRAELPTHSVEGRAVDIAADGALVIEGEDGQRTEVTVGDVVHLRPAT